MFPSTWHRHQKVTTPLYIPTVTRHPWFPPRTPLRSGRPSGPDTAPWGAGPSSGTSSFFHMMESDVNTKDIKAIGRMGKVPPDAPIVIAMGVTPTGISVAAIDHKVIITAGDDKGVVVQISTTFTDIGELGKLCLQAAKMEAELCS